MKTWFGAKLLFESWIDGRRAPNPLCEESIRMILADGADEAEERAEDVGKSAEHEYVNELGQTVRRVFVSVLEVQDLGEQELEDGVEVFSRHFRAT